MAPLIFQKRGFDFLRFTQVASQYLQGSGEIPCLRAESSAKLAHDKFAIDVFFHDGVLQEVCNGGKKYSRDIDAILTYGYVGQSRGGKNGVVAIPARDANFSNVVSNLGADKFKPFLDAVEFEYDPIVLQGVKVVTHRKNGERILGDLNRESHRVVLYDIGSYTK